MTPGDAPTVRVVRGRPTAQELAVLTVLVTAAASGDDAEEPAAPARGRWNDPAASHRRSWTPGVGGWRAAAR